MSLLFCTGFDYYPTELIGEVWDQIVGIHPLIVGVPARTGHAMSCPFNFGGVLQGVGLSHTSVLGFALFILSGGPGAIACFYDSPGGGPQLTITIGSSGKLQVRRGGYLGTVLGETAAPLPTAQWVYVECKATFDSAVGAVELRVDTTPIFALSGIDTSPTGLPWCSEIMLNVDSETIPSHGYNGPKFYDDMYILDGEGTYNNDFLDAPVVQCLEVNGEGAESGWVPVGASPNWRCVDGGVPGDWVSYVGARDDGQTDIYAVPTPNVQQVYGVQTGIRMRIVISPTTLAMREVVRSGGTEFIGDLVGGPISHYRFFPHDVDPDTGTPWTPDGVGQAQFGQRLIG